MEDVVGEVLDRENTGIEQSGKHTRTSRFGARLCGMVAISRNNWNKMTFRIHRSVGRLTIVNFIICKREWRVAFSGLTVDFGH